VCDRSTETKEVRLRPVTESHDYEVKVASARKFLSKGSKVKLTMQFSGRELRFKDQGKEMMLVSRGLSEMFVLCVLCAGVRAHA
jgi:translation initiation factor IF-3